MLDNKIYENVIKFAREGAKGQELTWYHILYGFVKLLNMNAAVLNALLESESEKEELRQIRILVDRSGVYTDLAKQALPMLWISNVTMNKEHPDLQSFENKIADQKNSQPAKELFRAVTAVELPELELLTKDHSMEDIMSYVEEHRQKERENLPETAENGEETVQQPETAVNDEETVQQPDPAADSSGASEQLGRVEGCMEHDDHEGFQSLIQKTREMNLVLQEKVIGQGNGIHTLVEGYFRSQILHGSGDDENSTLPVFLFAGPSGTGKTFLAEEAAKAIGLPFQKYDMTEFASPGSFAKLTGIPKPYQDAHEGQMTAFVREHPASVLIFDDLEYACGDMMQMLVHLIDDGRIQDSFTGNSVSFAGTLIFFTTKAGRALFEDRKYNLSSIPKGNIIDALRQEKDGRGMSLFTDSLCTRFETASIIMLDYLNVSSLIRIAEKSFASCADHAKQLYGYDLLMDPRLSSVFVLGTGENANARIATFRSRKMIEDELYEFGRHIPDLHVLDRLQKITFEVDVPEDNKEISAFLRREDPSNVLIIDDPDIWNHVPLGEDIAVSFAGSADEAVERFQEQNYDFVLIDPYFGDTENTDRFLSLDDSLTEGVSVFNILRERLSDTPAFMLEHRPIDLEDKLVFKQRGCQGFIAADAGVELADAVARIADETYLQKRMDDLAGSGRVITYNTAQLISDDETEAVIRLYDFRLRMEVQMDDRQSFLADADRPKEKFKDVIGAENAKSELKFFIEYMKNPRKFMAAGNKPPKGILLYGPPGTGKTMLARALAGESDVSFFPTTASSFSNKYFGESENNIRRLFKAAKRYAPSIIFIDELDAIGKERTGSESTHHTESMLNTLLTEMDGFEVNVSKPVFVLAATNYDLDGSVSGKKTPLDPALIRRFDNRIYVDLPNREEREQYLDLMIGKGQTQVSGEAIRNIAGRTTGESLATIKNIIELARRNAVKSGEAFDDEKLLNALEEYMYGEKKDWNENYYRSVAVHESGHAYISWLAGVKPEYVTIVSRGSFGGYMQSENEEQVPSYNRDQFCWKIRTSLAGRAAEICYFGEQEGVNTGIASDLSQATNYAINMICRYGMTEGSLISIDPSLILNSPMCSDIVSRVDKMLSEEMENTKKLIEDGKDKIDRLVDRLMKDNQVMGDTIDKLFKG